MDSAQTIRDFKQFVKENHDQILKQAINIRDLSKDDDWICDEEWEEVYKKEVVDLLLIISGGEDLDSPTILK